MALLLTSVFGVTGCGSDDGEAPVESRIKNSTNCPHSTARLSADRSYESLSKGFCSTPLQVQEFYDDLDDDDTDGNYHDFDYDYDENLRREPYIMKEKFRDVDELMFEPKSGDTIYDSPYDDINDIPNMHVHPDSAAGQLG